MPDITLANGQVLFRENKAAANCGCACGCCCKNGHIDRSLRYKNTCEEEGGTWGPCPGVNQCACECTPAATINGVAVAPGDPSSPEATATFLGEEAVTIPIAGSQNPVWKFWAVNEAFCIFGVYVLRVTIYVQLWLNGANWSAAFGFFGYQAAMWEFIFPEPAKFDDAPNSWPCPKASAAVLNLGPDGPDAAAVATYFGFLMINFGDPASAGWDTEFEAAAAAYFEQPTHVAINCTWSPPCVQPCELCDCTAAVSVNGVTLAPWSFGLGVGASPVGFPCSFSGLSSDGNATTSQQTAVSAPIDPIFYDREAQAVSVTSVGPFNIDGGLTVTKFVVTATAYYGCDAIRVVVDSYFSRDAAEAGLEEFYPNGLRTINGPMRIWQFYYDNWNGTGPYFCPGGEYMTVENCLFYSIPTDAEADCSAANPPVPGPNCPTIEWMIAVGAADGLDVVDEMPSVSLSCDVVPQ